MYFDRDQALTKYLDQFREDHPVVGPALRITKAELALSRGNIPILFYTTSTFHVLTLILRACQSPT